MFENVQFHTAILGGGLIGLSSLILFAFNGRIAGICGMAFSLMATTFKRNIWRMVFLVGLVMGSLAYHYVSGAPFPQGPDTSFPLLIAGGLLVGFGTSMGNGCTSGHGITGISRFSLRSIVATICFMASAIITLFIVKHVLGGQI